MGKELKKGKPYMVQHSPTPALEEPAVKYHTLNVILGGKHNAEKSIPGDFDLIKLTREGIKKSSLKTLASYLGISMEAMSGLLHTSYRNLQRKDDDTVLDTLKTERVLELATFAQRGIDVIGQKEAFAEWVQSPIVVLGNKKPLDFLDTSFGINILLKILGRLEQGVYS
jgi:putative toxin-antitoxin system antitoxin component (TIGR02293 family)